MAAHGDRDALRLGRGGAHDGILKLVEASMAGHRLAAEEGAEDEDVLPEARHALGLLESEAGVLSGTATEGYAEVDTPARQVVQGGEPAGKLRGVAHREQQDGGAEDHALGCAGGEGEQGQGLQQVGMVKEAVLCPQAVEPEPLGMPEEVDELRRGGEGAVRGGGEVQADANHACHCPPPTRQPALWHPGGRR